VSESNGSCGRVVVGVDGSAGSLAALDFAFDEAAHRSTGLLVVSAFDLPDVWSLTYGLPVTCTPEEIQHSVLETPAGWSPKHSATGQPPTVLRTLR
jgi:nucleotide-binding universal stress UspA family protein